MKIHLHEMVFYGYHGVHPEERKLGQRFIVNFSYESSPLHDREIKHLEDTIDYTKVYDLIRHALEKKNFLLLEVCANSILDEIMKEFPAVIYANVKIKKPSVPINGTLNSVEVEMERFR
jgi:dihydroneopterin aldolase